MEARVVHTIPADVSPLVRLSDEQLLRAHLSLDERAFPTLIARYDRELLHFLIRFLGNRAAAEDVFQEAFLQVHQSAGSFEPGRNFRPWLFTIAANKARDFLRSSARRRTASLDAGVAGSETNQFIELLRSADAGPDEKLLTQEQFDRVRSIIARLPDHLREIILLAYFNQFPYRQISEMLDIPLGTVKSRLHAAVASFGELWNRTNPPAGQA